MVGESWKSYRNLGIERSDLLRNSRWFFAHTTDGFLSGRSTSSNEKWARVPLCVVRHSTIHLWIIRCLLTENSWSNASMIRSTIINNYSGVNNFLATAERIRYTSCTFSTKGTWCPDVHGEDDPLCHYVTEIQKSSGQRKEPTFSQAPGSRWKDRLYRDRRIVGKRNRER